jgi:hypothetical protein
MAYGPLTLIHARNVSDSTVIMLQQLRFKIFITQYQFHMGQADI